MVRRSFVILVALASSASAVAQTAANAGQTAAPSLRPESILPQGTLIYFGTDDLDGLVQRTKTAPMGKILVEQEVKDFLAKPLGDLRKAIDQGVAMAKQVPGLESVELDVDKILAGPYGRAFFAFTQFDLAFKDGRPDPASIDIGLVIGLEPRAGAVDLFGLVKQIVTQVTASASHGELKFESVTVEGLTYERMRNPEAAVSLCFANVAGMPIVSLSEKSMAAIAHTLKTPGSSLQSDPDYARCVAAVGAPAPGDLVVFAQVGRIIDVTGRIAVAAINASDTQEGHKDIATIVEKGLAASKLAQIGPAYATSQRKDATSINVSYNEIDPKAGGLLALAAGKPVDLSLIKVVPKNAIAFSLGSFDVAPVWDTVVATMKDAAPAQHDEVMGMLKAFEAQLGGADAEGNPKWSLRRDLLGVLGGRMMSMTIPSAGLLFGPGGDTVGWIETSNAEQLAKSLALVLAFVDTQLADNEGFKIKFKEQAYGDVKLQVLDTSKLGMLAMAAGSMQPSWCIHDGKFWFGTTTKSLKKALDEQKPATPADPNVPPPENILAKADFAKRWVEPPAGTVVTSVEYGDTATIFENTYQQLMQVVPMLTTTGVMKDIPIDISLLPTAEAIGQHLFGTVTVSYRVGDHGHMTQSRGPFGPEAAVVLGGVIAGVATMVAYQKEHALTAEHAGAKRSKGGVPAPVDPSQKVDADFADLSASITVYIIANNKPPAELADLTKPATDYPKGYTQGQPLPVDPWGHAYAYSTDGKDDYKLWSLGPNGIDEKGAGDDIKPSR